MKLKSLLYVALVVLCPFAPAALHAQQEPLYSQHQFNPLTYNPGYAGSNEALSLQMQLRRQWWGVKGAPQGGMLSADWAGKDGRTGWGIGLNAQRIGLYDRADLHANYAYRMEMGEGKLALGIRGGGVWHQNRLTDAVLSTPETKFMGKIQAFLYPKSAWACTMSRKTGIFRLPCRPWFPGIQIGPLPRRRNRFSCADIGMRERHLSCKLRKDWP